MEHNVIWVDVEPYLQARQQPVYLMQRQPQVETSRANGVGEFWVPGGSLLDGDPDWSLCKSGVHVRVPVVAYRTPHRSHVTLLGLGVQLGIAAAVELRQKHGVETITGVTLVLGTQVDDLAPANALRCYIGLAVRVG